MAKIYTVYTTDENTTNGESSTEIVSTFSDEKKAQLEMYNLAVAQFEYYLQFYNAKYEENQLNFELNVDKRYLLKYNSDFKEIYTDEKNETVIKDLSIHIDNVEYDEDIINFDYKENIIEISMLDDFTYRVVIKETTLEN